MTLNLIAGSWYQVNFNPIHTYSTFGSTNCGVVTWYAVISEGGGGYFKASNFSIRIGAKLWIIFLLNQANGLIFGRRVLIYKSYNLRCILYFFCVAMVTVYKEALSMRSKVNNNGCFDFCDKYTLPMYLECAYNWYLLILENRLFKIFFFSNFKSNHSVVLNESWKLS